MCGDGAAEAMSDKIREEGRRFASFLQNNISSEERDRIHKQQHEDSVAEHAAFAQAFANGHCYICDSPLTAFDKKTSCLHWLLRPPGFHKKDLLAVTARYGVLQLQSYLRWVAAEDGRGVNINDLDPDDPEQYVIYITMRYKDLEWSISCQVSDYLGHRGSRHGADAHYHFQMRIGGRPFINYNDFHIPLNKNDIVHLEAMRSAPDVLKARWSFGHGMRDVLAEENLEHIIRAPRSDDARDDSAIKMDTLIIADEGTTLSGEMLFDLFREANEKQVSVASLVSKIPNASATVIISPGLGVVDEAPRAGGRGKGSK
jgi:hypothetical protein